MGQESERISQMLSPQKNNDMEISASFSSGVLYECVMLIVSILEKKKTILGVEPVSMMSTLSSILIPYSPF